MYVWVTVDLIRPISALNNLDIYKWLASCGRNMSNQELTLFFSENHPTTNPSTGIIIFCDSCSDKLDNSAQWKIIITVIFSIGFMLQDSALIRFKINAQPQKSCKNSINK